MDILLLILLVVLCALVAALLVKVHQGQQHQALRSSASPEELAATEKRLLEQFLLKFSDLEVREQLLARTQREELGQSLKDRFTEQSRLMETHLQEMREKLRNMGAMSETVSRLGEGVSRFNLLLGNVKMRGTWGEVQLGKLLEDVLAPTQFATNVKPNARSNKIVEFALILPGAEEGKSIYLPIDAKFPLEDYERLLQATDESSELAARRALIERIKLFSTQVAQYIQPPYTTDFAVLFLPTEGLYLEAAGDVSLAEDLRKKHIVLAGPQTLAAFLNALQVGFRTLAVQKQATKAWDLLAKAKRNVDDFLGYCDAVEKRLDEAQKALDNARGRVDQLNRNLRTITLPEEDNPHA